MLEIVLERENLNNFEGEEFVLLIDCEIGRKESFSVSLKFDDIGCWRGRKEEYVIGYEFKLDIDYLDFI